MTEDPCRLTLGPVRLSYVNLFTPQPDQAGRMKYAVTMLIPKSDTALVAKIQGGLQEAYRRGMEKGWWDERVPGGFKPGLRDADSQEEWETLQKNPAYAGCYFMKVTSNADYPAPAVVGLDRQPIVDKASVYSGMWGYVTVRLAPFNNQSKGLTGYLVSVLKFRDDDAFSSFVSDPESDYADIPLPPSAFTGAAQPSLFGGQQPAAQQVQQPAAQQVQQPMAQQVQQPTAQQPMAQQWPPATQPMAQQPTAQQPMAQQPTAQQPMAQQPMAQQWPPAANQAPSPFI